jgi:hypothetical protein
MQHHSCAGLLGELLQHVVALVEKELKAQPLADASQSGCSRYRIIGIGSRVEGVTVSVGGRKVLYP